MLYISHLDNQQHHCYNHCTDISYGDNTRNGMCLVILAYHTKDNIYIPKEIQMLQRLTDPPKYGSFPIINSLVISELYRIQTNMIWWIGYLVHFDRLFHHDMEYVSYAGYLSLPYYIRSLYIFLHNKYLTF